MIDSVIKSVTCRHLLAVLCGHPGALHCVNLGLGELTGSVVLWLPSHHPSGCYTLVVVEERPPLMIVNRFGCTAIHNKALYKCIIHSHTHMKQ